MYFCVICMRLICYLSGTFSYVRTGLALGRIGLSAIRPEFWAASFLSKAYFPYHFVGYKATEFSYKGNVGYKANFDKNLVYGLISDVDCM